MAGHELRTPAHERFEIAAKEGEVRAEPGELVGDRGADPATGAGDRRVKPGEWPRLRNLHRRTLGSNYFKSKVF